MKTYEIKFRTDDDLTFSIHRCEHHMAQIIATAVASQSDSNVRKVYVIGVEASSEECEIDATHMTLKDWTPTRVRDTFPLRGVIQSVDGVGQFYIDKEDRVFWRVGPLGIWHILQSS